MSLLSRQAQLRLAQEVARLAAKDGELTPDEIKTLETASRIGVERPSEVNDAEVGAMLRIASGYEGPRTQAELEAEVEERKRQVAAMGGAR